MVNQTVVLALRSTATKVFVCGAAIATAATASLAPAMAATFTCSTVAACVLAENTATSSKGAAIVGLSQSGDGIQGKTYFAGATSSSNAKSGIAGFDLSPSKGIRFYNSGVFGFSNSGSGVHGSTHDGSGVLAVATGAYGTGVNVMSQNVGVAITTSSTDNSDVALMTYSSSLGGAGIFAETGASVAVTGSAGDGVLGGNGVGVYGSANGGGVGVLASGYAPTTIPLLVDAYKGDTVIEAQSYPANAGGAQTRVLTLDHNGNLDVYGHITSTSPAMFVTRRADGRRVMAYAPREAEATIEDVGEAQLTAGVATVPLAADFAAFSTTQS